MNIGIIAEGKSDLAVISNVLKGKLAIDKSDIEFLQPELDFDETDLHNMPKRFSNWELVKRACIERKKLSDFFSVDEERLIVLHMDTAEAEEKNYGVERPPKRDNIHYSQEMRKNVIGKIDKWLGNQFSEKLFYAIAIEEIEAWVITIYTDKRGDTSKFNDPKKELNRILNRKFTRKEKNTLRLDNELLKFDKLSKDFAKKRLFDGKYLFYKKFESPYSQKISNTHCQKLNIDEKQES